MKVLVVLLLFLVCAAPLRARESAQSPVRVHSVQADFVQEKQMAILVRPILSKGQFLFQAPGSLRWEYFSPIHTVLLMHDGHTRKFVEHDGSFVEEHGMGVNSMQIVLQEITGWLDGEITDTPTFQVQSNKGNLVVLVPQDAALAKIISRIELQLLGQTGLMESVTLYEDGDSLTKMTFSNGVLNAAIQGTRFTKP